MSSLAILEEITRPTTTAFRLLPSTFINVTITLLPLPNKITLWLASLYELQDSEGQYQHSFLNPHRRQPLILFSRNIFSFSGAGRGGQTQAAQPAATLRKPFHDVNDNPTDGIDSIRVLFNIILSYLYRQN